MKETFASRVSKADSLIDVLTLLKEKILMDTHVATLAYFEEYTQKIENGKNYGIIKCKPFPLHLDQGEYSIYVYYFKEDTNEIYNKGDILCVLFTDLNFIGSLNNPIKEPKNTSDEIFHNLKYGIIINTM